MGGMTMPAAPGVLRDFGAAALMWAVMMAAMMLPSAVPMVALFRRGRPPDWPLFGAGYLAVWLAVSLPAAALQLVLHHTLLLSTDLTAASAPSAAALLLLAGLYQFSRLKSSCLAHCQSPLGFIMTHWREGHGGALRMGLQHGVHCLGCCWALMGLLFVFGVMNLAWVAGLAAYVLVEKTLVRGPRLARLTGAALTGAGLVVLAVSLT